MSLYYNLVADYSPRTSDIIEEPLDVQVFRVNLIAHAIVEVLIDMYHW